MIDMFENILENKLFKSTILSLVCVMIIFLAVPTTKDSKTVVRNEDTGQKEFKQEISEVFVFSIIAAVFLPVLLFNVSDKQPPEPKRLTLPQVWSKISQAELMKFELQEVESILMRGDYIFAQSSRNKNVYHLRYTDHTKSCIMNIALYVMDDFTKFMTSPLMGLTTMPMGVDSAQSRLIKSQDSAARDVQTAKAMGITPEEMKRRLLQKEIDAQNRPRMEDDLNES